MGSYFVNFHIRSTDAAAVAKVAAEVVQGRAYLSPAKDGWVTLYDEVSEGQDAYEIGRISEALSINLDVAVLAFLVNDSSLLIYYLFEHGNLTDEYNSSPVPTNPNAESEQHFRFNGRPEILLQYCPPGTPRVNIEEALMRPDSLIEGGFASSMGAEERLRPLVAALKINETRALAGFNDFERRWSTFPDSNLFIPIGGKPPRKLAIKRIPPPIPPRK